MKERPTVVDLQARGWYHRCQPPPDPKDWQPAERSNQYRWACQECGNQHSLCVGQEWFDRLDAVGSALQESPVLARELLIGLKRGTDHRERPS